MSALELLYYIVALTLVLAARFTGHAVLPVRSFHSVIGPIVLCTGLFYFDISGFIFSDRSLVRTCTYVVVI